MRIKLAIPDRLVTPEALEAALEATALANEQAILRGEVPPITEAIRKGVRWQEEPFADGEHFDLARVVIGRKWGDCDDLAPWLAGELRATGEDPGAIPRVYQSGPNKWHVVVQSSSGEILDPSRWAGMGRKSSVSGCRNGICGASATPFARPGNGAIALMHKHGSYWARCDVPYPDSDSHLASHARANCPDRALDRAISGAIACGEPLGVDCERVTLAGTILLGDPDTLDEIGVLPMAATLAPMALEQGKSLAKGLLAKGSGEAFYKLQMKAIRGSMRKKGMSEEEIKAAMESPEWQAWKSKNYPKMTAKESAVSVPMEDPATRATADQHMFLSYYPTNAQGPVVMRF